MRRFGLLTMVMLGFLFFALVFVNRPIWFGGAVLVILAFLFFQRVLSWRAFG